MIDDPRIAEIKAHLAQRFEDSLTVLDIEQYRREIRYLLERVRAQEWVSVSERLPENNQLVEVAEICRYIGGERPLWELTDGKPTRWRKYPLPAPPEANDGK